MGKILDATYTTLSIGYSKIKLYSVWTFKFRELLAEYVKENWNRFLNDCQIPRLGLKNYYSL